MQKNETMLTPVYRYVFSVLDESAVTEDRIRQMRVFKSHLRKSACILTETKEIESILDCTIELLERFHESEEIGQDFWNNKLKALQCDSCQSCYHCKKCRIYYWKELGEVLLQKTNDEKKSKTYFPVRSLPDEIQRHLEPSASISTLYLSRIKRDSIGVFRNKFLMLKGMSSSTPAMLNNIFDTNDYVGGGFYLNWNGYGVAIDPGYSFVHNLHHYGLSVLDVQAVIITHEHIDHNNDMRLLDDLHFSAARFDEEKEKTHIIDWYMDEISYAMASVLRTERSGFKEETCRLHRVMAGDSAELKTNELDVTFFPTKHIPKDGTYNYKEHTFGCSFCCKNKVQKKIITYTSDTKYFNGLLEAVKEADMVIANISGIYEDDYMQIKEKSTHLGYGGCYNLIRKCSEKYGRYPRFYFLSEFWNGKSDIRYDILKCLKRELEEQGITDIRIIPSETGMLYDIEDGSIQCSQCGQYTDEVIVKRPTGLNEKIEVLCRECYF